MSGFDQSNITNGSAINDFMRTLSSLWRVHGRLGEQGLAQVATRRVNLPFGTVKQRVGARAFAE